MRPPAPWIRSRSRPARNALLVTASVGLICAAVLSGSRQPPGAGTAVATSTAPPRAPAAAAVASVQPGRAGGTRGRPPALALSGQAPTDAEIRDLLGRRAAAVRGHDRAAFLRTVDPRSPAFREVQQRYLANLAAVPLATWSYRLTADPVPAVPAARLRRYAAPTRVAAVYLDYGLRGMSGTARQPQYVTFVQRGSRWYVGSDADADGSGARTARDMWDFGPVLVAAGRHCLVLGHPGSVPLVHRVLGAAEEAVPAVTAVWGRWAQRVLVLVPRSPGEMAALAPAGARAVGRFAAVETAEFPSAVTGTPAADRIIVNPSESVRLTEVGLRVVITHEVTHSATRQATGTAAPEWVVEGFADYVGYRGSGISTAAAAAELAAAVRAGRLPATLPVDADFAASGTRLVTAYEQAWLACRLIAARAGPAGLVRFYRLVGAVTPASTDLAGKSSPAPPTTPDARTAGPSPLDRALRAVVHLDPTAFTTAWRAYLVSVLR